MNTARPMPMPHHLEVFRGRPCILLHNQQKQGVLVHNTLQPVLSHAQDGP